MCWWDRWLWELGFAVCHQLPERMFHYPQGPLFVCSRDTGLFVSFFTVLLALSFLRARNRAGMPPLPVLLLAGGGIVFLAADAVSSYLGLRETSNTLRFLSGFAAGGGLALPFAALINGAVFGGDGSLKAGSRWSDLLAAGGAAACAVCLYLWRPGFLYRPGQAWLLVCMLGTLVALNLLFVSLLLKRKEHGLSWSWAVLAVALMGAELGIAYVLHRAAQGSGPLPPA